MRKKIDLHQTVGADDGYESFNYLPLTLRINQFLTPSKVSYETTNGLAFGILMKKAPAGR